MRDHNLGSHDGDGYKSCLRPTLLQICRTYVKNMVIYGYIISMNLVDPMVFHVWPIARNKEVMDSLAKCY